MPSELPLSLRPLIGQTALDMPLPGRRCYECRKTKDATSFSRHRSGGIEFYNRRCNSCRGKRQYGTQKVRDKKRLVELAKDQPCVVCRQRFPLVAMDLDHVKGCKRFNASSAWRWAAKERLVVELAKCEPICSNCHRVRSQERKQSRGRPPRTVPLDLADVERAAPVAELSTLSST